VSKRNLTRQADSTHRVGDLKLAALDLLRQHGGLLALHAAADGGAGSQDLHRVSGASGMTGRKRYLQDGPRELLGLGAGAHGTGDVVHIVQLEVSVVLDVLDLLAVWTENVSEESKDAKEQRPDIPRAGSLRALSTSAVDEAMTSTRGLRFWMMSLTVIFKPAHSLVSAWRGEMRGPCLLCLLGTHLDHIRGLLGRHTERTQFGGQDGHVGGLASNASAAREVRQRGSEHSFMNTKTTVSANKGLGHQGMDGTSRWRYGWATGSAGKKGDYSLSSTMALASGFGGMFERSG
jgi:hypothetical protein